MADPHPRYVVREIAGYNNKGRAAWTTSYWVADSWYCYAVVAEPYVSYEIATDAETVINSVPHG